MKYWMQRIVSASKQIINQADTSRTIFIRRDSRMTSKPNVSSRETVNSRICVSIIKIQRGRK